MAKLFDAIASACAEVTKAIKTYIDTVALVEKDPTVPAWAKAAKKPSYGIREIEGASEVAASGSYNDLIGAPEGVRYPSTEEPTGTKWLDGKPVYRVAYMTEEETTDGSWSSLGIIRDLDTVVSITGAMSHLRDAGSAAWYPLYCVSADGVTGRALVSKGADASYGQITASVSGLANATVKFCVVVEYTKTTDEATVTEEE